MIAIVTAYSDGNGNATATATATVIVIVMASKGRITLDIRY